MVTPCSGTQSLMRVAVSKQRCSVCLAVCIYGTPCRCNTECAASVRCCRARRTCARRTSSLDCNLQTTAYASIDYIWYYSALPQAHGGSRDVLEFLHERGFTYERIVHTAIYNNNLALLKWLLETKACTIDRKPNLDAFIRNGNWDMLMYLKQASGITWNNEQIGAMIDTAGMFRQASIATNTKLAELRHSNIFDQKCYKMYAKGTVFLVGLGLSNHTCILANYTMCMHCSCNTPIVL
jgi:hypothetical protein